MRIGLVSYEYPPQSGLGGVGSYTVRLASALGRAGHDVVVLCGPSNGQADLPLPNVTVKRIPARYEPKLPTSALRWAYWRGLAPLLERSNRLVWHWLRWDLASTDALREIHRSTPLDVIEAPEHAANALGVARANEWPTVARIHGPWDLFFPINRTPGMVMNHLMAWLEKQGALHAHVRTTPSRAMAKFIQKRWHLDEPPIPVPNFMDVPAEPPPLPSPNDENRWILCAGRLERFKGQDVLVRGFARIAPQHPRAQLMLIGPDHWTKGQTFSEIVDEMVKDREIRSRIHLTGPLPLAKTQALLRTASIAVIPSSGFESFSFSTLEAMAAGRPTVVARSGAMPELVDFGRCGKIFTPGDDASLAQCLDELLSDPSLATELASLAHDRARSTYDTQAALPQFLEAFNQARDLFHPARRGQPSPPLQFQRAVVEAA